MVSRLNLVALIVRFFAEKLDLVVRADDNLRRRLKPQGARNLARRINQIPEIKEAGMRITPSQMEDASTIREIAAILRSSTAEGSKQRVARRARPKASSARELEKTNRPGGGLRFREDRVLKFGIPSNSRNLPGRESKLNFSYKSTTALPRVSFQAKTYSGWEVAVRGTKKRPPERRSQEATNDDIQYGVWYGTNRKPVDSSDASRGYSEMRDQSMHLGFCEVFVPKSHKIGSIGSSWLRRFLDGNDDRLKLTKIDELSEKRFWSSVKKYLETIKPAERDALIFVHGYNVSFKDAAIRAAQIGVDLAIPGAMAFFSWPSKAKKRSYLVDASTIEASEPFIEEFILNFAKKSGARRVHIIAHSMGNRGLLRAVDRIATAIKKKSDMPFGQIILAAADVDADHFRDLSAAYSRVCRQTTLYVSTKDLAVEMSSWLHEFSRVGMVPPVTVVKGIDTINVTNSDLSMLGHGYVAEARDVLKDMHDLIINGTAPDRRFGLREAKTKDGKRFWEIGA